MSDKEKIKALLEGLEQRIEALEGNIATSGYCQPAQGVQNTPCTIESSGNLLADVREIKSIKATSMINPKEQ